MNPALHRLQTLGSVLELLGFLVLVPQLGIVAFLLFDLDVQDGVTATELLLMKVFQVPLALLVVALLQRKHGEGFHHLGWRFPRSSIRTDLLQGLAWVLPLIALSALVRTALVGAGLEVETPFIGVGGMMILLWLVVAIFGGGVAEEIQYRGFVFRRLEAILPASAEGARPWPAILLTSLAFALPHAYQGTATVGTILVLAIFLQLLYLRQDRRLLPVMVCHAGFNALQIALLAAAT